MRVVSANDYATCKKIVIPECLYRDSSFFSQLKSGFQSKAYRNDTIKDFCKRLEIHHLGINTKTESDNAASTHIPAETSDPRPVETLIIGYERRPVVMPMPIL